MYICICTSIRAHIFILRNLFAKEIQIGHSFSVCPEKRELT